MTNIDTETGAGTVEEFTGTEINVPKFQEEVIKVKDLSIDRVVQRGFLDPKKVDRIIKNFNAAALNVIIVSRRGKMVNVVLDGAHRVEAVRRLTGGDGEVLCHVFTDLSRETEAQMFLDLNAGNQPHLIDRFKVRIVAGDPVATGMNEVLNAYGWKVDNRSGNGYFQPVGAAEKIYLLGKQKNAAGEEKYGDLFQDTIMILSHAWKGDHTSVMAPILESIAAILLEYGSDLDTGRLERTLVNYSGGPRGLLEDGRQLARSLRGRASMGIAARLVDEYNVGLKTRRLRTWRRTR